MVAALQADYRQIGRPHSLLDQLQRGGIDHLVPDGFEDQQRLVDLVEMGLDVRATDARRDHAACSGAAVVAALHRVGQRDVAADPAERRHHVPQHGQAASAGRLELIDGLTTASPATASPCCSASRMARPPPIERPPTKTWSHSARRVGEGPVDAGVPVRPNGSGSSPASWCRDPAAAAPRPGTRRRPGARAHGRIDCGEPVKPWQSSTPSGPDPRVVRFGARHDRRRSSAHRRRTAARRGGASREQGGRHLRIVVPPTSVYAEEEVGGGCSTRCSSTACSSGLCHLLFRPRIEGRGEHPEVRPGDPGQQSHLRG